MRVTVEDLDTGSCLFRVWLGEPPGNEDPGSDIDAVCVLKRLNQYECEIAAAKGELTDDANIEIGLKALDLGYKYLHFHRSAGGPASRWATKVKTVAGMDYYTVDLEKAAAEL